MQNSEPHKSMAVSTRGDLAVSDELKLLMLERMLTIREVEELLSRVYFEGKVPGSLDLCIGEEAVAVGACLALEREDAVTSTHRGHGHVIAKGADVRRFLAEIMGREAGFCKGKGGSLHVADVQTGVYGTGIVGGGIPIAAGLGFASKLLGRRSVALAFFGDGAAQQGQFHETLNLAALWQLPVIFLCQNNGYATTTRAEQASASPTIAERAGAYAMPGVLVDGNDVGQVYEAVARARAQAVAGEGPSLIEAKTYRVSPQVEGEEKVFATRRPYRSAEEVQRWKEPDRDPIARWADALRREGLLVEETESALRAAVRDAVTEAFAFAESAPFAEEVEAFTDVYASPVGGHA